MRTLFTQYKRQLACESRSVAYGFMLETKDCKFKPYWALDRAEGSNLVTGLPVARGLNAQQIANKSDIYLY